MITVLLQGGLGNQMFQYAFGRALSLKYVQPFQLDLSFIVRRDLGPNFVYRNYDLDLFLIKPRLTYSDNSEHHVKEPGIRYSQDTMNTIDKLLRQKKSIHLNGYWQSERYFEECKDVIRHDFRPAYPVVNRQLLRGIQTTESVMVNVRRTDYLQNNFHGTMSPDYYVDAVKKIESKVENPFFYIFGDDIEWCEQNVKIPNSMIVNHSFAGERFIEYLIYMQNCKHFIIPNSTFAWWAAWLNRNRGTVIYPDKWFTSVGTDITKCFDNV